MLQDPVRTADEHDAPTTACEITGQVLIHIKVMHAVPDDDARRYALILRPLAEAIHRLSVESFGPAIDEENWVSTLHGEAVGERCQGDRLPSPGRAVYNNRVLMKFTLRRILADGSI